MTDPLGPESLELRLREMERRLMELETSQRAAYTSILDDAGVVRVKLTRSGLTFYDASGNIITTLDDLGLRVFDSAGVLRARLGYLDGSAGYGVRVHGASNEQLFEANDDGLRYPALNSPWIPQLTAFNGIYTPVTDAAFVNVYQAEFSQITHLGFAATIVCTSDAGTTGEFRLSADAGGTTSAVTVPSGSAGTMQLFEWLHGLTLATGPTSFRVQAKRTGGAGNVNVYLPARASMVDNLVCSTTGL